VFILPQPLKPRPQSRDLPILSVLGCIEFVFFANVMSFVPRKHVHKLTIRANVHKNAISFGHSLKDDHSRTCALFLPTKLSAKYRGAHSVVQYELTMCNLHQKNYDHCGGAGFHRFLTHKYEI